MPDVSHFKRKLPGNLRNVLGVERAGKLKRIRNAFETEVPPPHAFLRWMLQNPQRLRWPTARNGKKQSYCDPTQDRRQKFMAGDAEVSSKGLSELENHGVKGSRRKWWAFEGWTSVDCLLETERLMLFVEGKRTEGISRATAWFPSRNQIIRNVEVARAWADGKKNYAVLICAETPVELPPEAWKESLPHLSESERVEMQSHFLGCVTWPIIAKELCGNMQLPDNLDDAVTLCLSFR